MSKTKPFAIPKALVVKAYELVKANKGAAGVDQQSLSDFDEHLTDMESIIVRQLLPASGKGRTDTEEAGR